MLPSIWGTFNSFDDIYKCIYIWDCDYELFVSSSVSSPFQLSLPPLSLSVYFCDCLVAAFHVAMCYLLLIYDLDAHRTHICETLSTGAAYRNHMPAGCTHYCLFTDSHFMSETATCIHPIRPRNLFIILLSRTATAVEGVGEEWGYREASTMHTCNACGNIKLKAT